MKLLCFDVESNGLHGPAFAVGGVVYDTIEKRVIDQVLYRTDSYTIDDKWVLDNVLPAMQNIAITHDIAEQMRNAFWLWLQYHMPSAPLVIVDVGYPVEARFLLQCQDDDSHRAWEAPYPLHELASILLAAGMNPDMSRFENKQSHLQHNPLEDARRCAALAAYALSTVGISDD